MYILYGVLRVADMLFIMGSAALAHAIWFPGALGAAGWQRYYLAGLAGTLIASIVFHFQGIYVYKQPRIPFGRLRIASVAVAWTITVLILIVLAFAFYLSESFSRTWVALWWALALMFMTIARIFRWSLERAWLRDGKLMREVVIYGGGENAAKLVQSLRSSGDIGFRILGYFDERPLSSNRHHPVMLNETYLGSIKDLLHFGRTRNLHQIIVALPWSAEKRLLDVCRKLRSLPVDIQIAPDFVGFHTLNPTYSTLGGVTLMNVFPKPLADWHYVIKELEDRLLGSLFLLGLAPLMLMIAALIKLDSKGPVFFKQKRYGFNNGLISVYKFRTMYADQCDYNADKLATRDDPRVTRVGRWLRKTSFDELPQLINVLKGEMSIVGPRPHALGAKAADRLYEEVVEEYAARHRVKPGITGWAQVKGWRGETDTVEKIQKRVEHDLYYIENWTPALDVKILAMTVRALLKPDNAF